MEDIPLNIQMCYICQKGHGYALIYPKVCGYTKEDAGIQVCRNLTVIACSVS